MDNTTRRRWEEYIEDKEFVSTSTIMEFLQKHCQLLRRSAIDDEISKSGSEVFEKDKSGRQRAPSTRLRSKTTLATATQERKCCLCQGQHLIYGCNKFLNLSVKDRIEKIKRLKLCLNCLRPDHFARTCRSGSCKNCGKRHNTLCHTGGRVPTETTMSSSGNLDEPSIGATLCSMMEAKKGMSTRDVRLFRDTHNQHIKSQHKRVLMATAIVNVMTSSGDSKLRVLLDSASELNFITSTACKKLNLKTENIREQISGLNGMSYTINHGCRLSIKSRTSNFNLNLHCLVVPEITKNLPAFFIQSSRLFIPENLKLADPLFFNPGQIDALIGSKFFLQLLDHGRIELGENMPILQNTRFGWIIAGSISSHLIGSRAIDHSQLITRVY